MSFLHCLSNWIETAKHLFKHPKSTRLLTIKPRYVYGTGRVIQPTNNTATTHGQRLLGYLPLLLKSLSSSITSPFQLH